MHEFMESISAAKQNSGAFKDKDPLLQQYMLQLSSVMRIRNLRAWDLFEMLDLDGGGTLSVSELQAGLVSACEVMHACNRLLTSDLSNSVQSNISSSHQL